MDIDQITNTIDRLRNYSIVVQQAIDDNTELVSQLNNLSAPAKQHLRERYKNAAGPVTTIRKQVSQNIAEGMMTVPQIQHLTETAITEHPKSFRTIYQSWFSILYPLLLQDMKQDVADSLQFLAKSIIDEIGGGNALTAKIFDFHGERQNGSERCWIAIINKSHKSQTTAKQLFINIENGTFEYCLLNFPANIRTDNTLVPKGEPVDIQNMMDVFRKHLPEIIKDTVIAAPDELLLQPGTQVCKISMGPDDINDEIYTNFLNANLVLVNGSTGPMASSAETQGELFKENLRIGDYFYLCRGNRKLVLIGRFTGPSEDAEDDDLADKDWKQRSFEVIKHAITSESYQDEKKWWTPNFRSTCVRIPKSELAMANEILFEPFFNTRLIYQSKSMQLQPNHSVMQPPLNQILFGPPGTGKTYHTIDRALGILNVDIKGMGRPAIKKLFDKKVEAGQIIFTTFHQNMAYEDFIEGIKPETDKGNITYDVQPGIFRKLCDAAQTPNEIEFSKAYDQLKKDLAEKGQLELKTPKGKTFWVSLNSNDNLNLYTGDAGNKQGSLTKDSLQRQINQDPVYFGWESYFNGLITHLADKYGYHPKPTEKKERYVLIIDEINRGNVSQIFGELITLIEDDKRAGCDEAISVTLPYSKRSFSVPSNVYLLGTMNTADRSVEALDAALRRRFSFVEMLPQPHLLHPANMLSRFLADAGDKTTLIYKDSESRLLAFIGAEATLSDQIKAGTLADVSVEALSKFSYTGIRLDIVLSTMNKRLTRLLDKDHQIGHSYFINLDSIEGLLKAFQNKIIPLLQEYFFGDLGKIGLVLGGGFMKEVEDEAAEDVFADFSYDTGFLEGQKTYVFKDYAPSFEQALNQLIAKS